MSDAKLELRNWIQRQLGDPIVEVELESEHLDQAIENALEWWASVRGWCRERVLDIQAGVDAYDLSSWTPEVKSVVRVIWPATFASDRLVAYPGFLDYDGYPYNALIPPESHGRYSTLVQEMQYIRMASIVLGGGFEWDWDRDAKTLKVSPVPQDSGKAVVFYEAPMTAQDIAKLDARDRRLVYRWALADAKEILGRIRGKYDSLPAATGSVSLDGRDLLSEAQQEKEKLDEEILLASGSPSIIVG